VGPTVARVLVAWTALLAMFLICAAMCRAASPPAYLVGTSDNSTLRFVVDGKVVAQTKVGAPSNVSQAPVEIGSFLRGEVFYGTIDEVAIYDRPLSLNTLSTHYRAGTVGGEYARNIEATPGLVAYWRLDDATTARAKDVLGKHPGIYRAGTVLRVSGLLAHDSDRAAAFDGGAGDVIVEHAAGLSLPHGFTLEAWVAPGAVRDQTVLSKPNSWFVKSDPRGRWGFGVFVGKKIVSVYAKQRSEASPAPIAQAKPPPTAPLPKSGGKSENHQDSGSDVAVILWAVIIAAGTGGWLIYRSRRRRTGSARKSPGGEPDDRSNDVEGGEPDARNTTRVGS
jgi:hypothetical protein